ncbi:MAG: hypothetical protein IT236_01280 [Bacteroidia bacterium]|nr:hypothetical protein [Bacteroidia bacterium]
MKLNSTNAIKNLSLLAYKFDEESKAIKKTCLLLSSKNTLKPGKWLLAYYDLLLFLLAHPQDEQTSALVEKELVRISNFLKQKKYSYHALHHNSSLPYSKIVTHFSHDLISSLLQNNSYQLDIDAFEDGGADLSDVLKLCLPSAERELTTYGFNRDELFEELGINKAQQLAFIVERLSGFNGQPLTKDYLFDSLQLSVEVFSKDKAFSRAYNRFLKAPVYYHHDLVKRFPHLELFHQALPPAYEFKNTERDELIKTIKDSLTLTARETDPATYLDENSLRFYQLERGIAVAIYSMTAMRQLPFESYVGYTLFKNGFPAAYGGAWVFGKRALFGMNIFESFRGGESGYMMCQLLRVYRQVFGIDCFEVEPYQFGKDNPDGIKSGAFWFYYRYGFRPNHSALKKLAETEQTKIAANKAYHSSYKTLEKFTDSFINLELEKTKQLRVSEYSGKITAYIAKRFKGNRGLAETESVRFFCEAAEIVNPEKTNALTEYALLCGALGISDKTQLALLKEMVLQKPANVFKYQQALLQFLEAIK